MTQNRSTTMDKHYGTIETLDGIAFNLPRLNDIQLAILRQSHPDNFPLHAEWMSRQAGIFECADHESAIPLSNQEFRTIEYSFHNVPRPGVNAQSRELSADPGIDTPAIVQQSIAHFNSACKVYSCTESQTLGFPNATYPRRISTLLRRSAGRPSPLREELTDSDWSLGHLFPVPESDEDLRAVTFASTANAQRSRTSWTRVLAAQNEMYHALLRENGPLIDPDTPTEVGDADNEQGEEQNREEQEDEIGERDGDADDEQREEESTEVDSDEEEDGYIFVGSDVHDLLNPDGRTRLRSWNGKLRRGSLSPSSDEDGGQRNPLRRWNGRVRRGSRCPVWVGSESDVEREISTLE